MVLLHLVDVDHLVAVLALADVAVAVGLVEVDAVHWEFFVAVAALLLLLLHDSNNNKINRTPTRHPPTLLSFNKIIMRKDRRRESDGLTGWAHEEE